MANVLLRAACSASSSSLGSLSAASAAGGLASFSERILSDISGRRQDDCAPSTSQAGQVRCKVYTSNVMDAERSRRISQHFGYYKARKEWQKKMGGLIMQWKADVRQTQLQTALEEAQKTAAELAAHKARELAFKQAAAKRSIKEQLSRAEVELQVVSSHAC